MGENPFHTVGRGIFQMEEVKTMGPDDSNESRHSLPMGVGNDKRVDRKNKASSDCSVKSSGIQAEERWWNEAEFSIHRRQLGRIEQTKFIVQAIPNVTLKELVVQMDSDLGCEVTCDVRTIKEYQLENCGMAFLSPRHSVCQELCVMNGQRGTNCGRIWEPQRTKFNVSSCSTLKHVYTKKQKR